MIQASKQPPPAGAWCVPLPIPPAPPVVMVGNVFFSEFVRCPPRPSVVRAQGRLQPH